MHKWANVCTHSKFIQLTFSSVRIFIYIHTHSKYRKFTTKNMSTVYNSVLKKHTKLPYRLSGFVIKLEIKYSLDSLLLHFNYSQLYKTIFHFLVKTD